MYFIFVINTYFASQLNDVTKLAGYGLGATWLNVVCFSTLVGANSALDTLVSQAFGANEIRLCGVYLNQGRCVCTVLFMI